MLCGSFHSFLTSRFALQRIASFVLFGALRRHFAMSCRIAFIFLLFVSWWSHSAFICCILFSCFRYLWFCGIILLSFDASYCDSVEISVAAMSLCYDLLHCVVFLLSFIVMRCHFGMIRRFMLFFLPVVALCFCFATI